MATAGIGPAEKVVLENEEPIVAECFTCRTSSFEDGSGPELLTAVEATTHRNVGHAVRAIAVSLVLAALTLTGCRNPCSSQYQPEDYTPICSPRGKWVPR